MGTIKRTRGGSPPERGRTEGGRSVGSTDDSGPMKPGNSVEDKTLKTGEELRMSLSFIMTWEATDERRYKQRGRVDIVLNVTRFLKTMKG